MNDLFDKILVFDLDDTIIDIQKIKDILFKIANELGCEPEAARGIYRKVRDGGFTLGKFVQELGAIIGREESEIRRQMEQAILGKKDELLFPDVKDFLELCRAHKTKMHLLTFGAESWQREKMSLLDLEKYFPRAIPTEDEAEGKLGELSMIIGAEDGAGVVLFNDKLGEIKAALARFPKLLAYWRNGQEQKAEVLADMDGEARKQIKVSFDFREIFSEVYDGESKIGVVILAAGRGTRMKSDKLKVMHELRGRPLIDYVVSAVETLGWPEKSVVVVCQEDIAVQGYLGSRARYVIQEKQLGTGQAVAVAESILKDKVDHVVVLYGDMPFITSVSIKRLADQHLENNDMLTLMTTVVTDFAEWRKNLSEYGRIIRGENGDIIKIIEKKDATPELLEIKEVNPGYFCFQADWLWENLKKLKNNNAQGEYYLTDLAELAFEQQVKVSSIGIDPKEAVGINTLENLQIANQILFYGS